MWVPRTRPQHWFSNDTPVDGGSNPGMSLAWSDFSMLWSKTGLWSIKQESAAAAPLKCIMTGQSALVGFWRLSDLQKLLTRYLGQTKRVQADRHNVQELLSRNDGDKERDFGINLYRRN